MSPYFIFEGGLGVGATGLAIHFSSMKKIFEGMYKKNSGEMLKDSEVADIRKAGKIGKSLHLCAATGVLGAFGAMTYVSGDPILLQLSVAMPFWYYFCIHKGYEALYSSAMDYTLGEKKNFSTAQKF